MLRKIGFGILWFIALNLIAGILIGIVAGVIAVGGETDSRTAFEAGRAVGQSMAWLRPYVLVATALVSIVGALKGFLPGTGERPPRPSDDA